MVKRKSSDDHPHIGQQSGGMILVCHGDDRPTEWADWLEPLIGEYSQLLEYAEEFGFDLVPSDDASAISSVMEFCEALGISFDSNYWEGSLISGVYQFGWLPKGQLRNVKKTARGLLDALEVRARAEVKASILASLSEIDDLDELIDRVRDDRDDLKSANKALEGKLRKIEENRSALLESLEAKNRRDSFELDKACLDIALALLRRQPCPLLAGPLVLWEDGVVYAITERGGVLLPTNSSPARLLAGLVGSGIQIVTVSEMTVIGSWRNGPHYRKGTAEINGWSTVWSDRENSERKFSVDPPEFAEQVEAIHAYYRDQKFS